MFFPGTHCNTLQLSQYSRARELLHPLILIQYRLAYYCCVVIFIMDKLHAKVARSFFGLGRKNFPTFRLGRDSKLVLTTYATANKADNKKNTRRILFGFRVRVLVRRLKSEESGKSITPAAIKRSFEDTTNKSGSIVSILTHVSHQNSALLR